MTIPPHTRTSTRTSAHLSGVGVVHQHLSASENAKLPEGRDWSVNQGTSVKMHYLYQLEPNDLGPQVRKGNPGQRARAGEFGNASWKKWHGDRLKNVGGNRGRRKG